VEYRSSVCVGSGCVDSGCVDVWTVGVWMCGCVGGMMACRALGTVARSRPTGAAYRPLHKLGVGRLCLPASHACQPQQQHLPCTCLPAPLPLR
jgi:hypothetical protein